MRAYKKARTNALWVFFHHKNIYGFLNLLAHLTPLCVFLQETFIDKLWKRIEKNVFKVDKKVC